jgi:hypothetical protein
MHARVDERHGVYGGQQIEQFRAEAPHRRTRYIVNALGREFRVTDEMAQIFLRQVARIVAADESALVILRHRHGVELLLVRDDSSFSIRPAD